MSLVDKRRLLVGQNTINIPRDGLIAEYLFDNNLHNTAPGSAFAPGDMTTSYGATYTTGPGRLNAIQWNYSARMTLAASISMQQSRTFSFSVWFKNFMSSTSSKYFSLMNDSFSYSGSRAFDLLMYLSSFSIPWISASHVASNNSTYRFYDLPVASVPNDSSNFHHVCGSIYYDSSKSSTNWLMDFYVDGVSIPSASNWLNSSGFFNQAISYVQLNTGSQALYSEMAGLRLWYNYKLTASDAFILYREGK